MREDIVDKNKRDKEYKEHQEQLSVILENTNDLIWVLSWPDLSVEYISPSTKKFTGYSIKKFKEDPNMIRKITHPDDRNLLDEALQKLKDNGQAKMKTRIITKDGDIKWTHDRSWMVYDEKGQPVKIAGISRDITIEKVMEERLKLMNFSVDNVPVGIFLVSPEGRFEYVNRKACEYLNYSREELVGKNIDDIAIEPKDRKNHWDKIKNDKYDKFEADHKTRDGRIIPVQITSCYLEYMGKEYEFTFAQDITERKKREKEIENMLYKDPLTNLYNRRFMEEEINRLNTERQLPISFIICDVNGLKLINDSMGHEKGDELLVKAARILKEVVREEDILARYGGDEFAILLPQTHKKAAQKVIERIRRECQKTQADNLVVSLGIGMAAKTSVEEDISDMLKEADDNMYQNKLMASKSRKHEVVSGLVNALGAKSDETKEHAMRMTALAHRLGDKIGVTAEQSNKLSLLATLHDIGKISIPERILTKPDKPTEKEWEELKKHPENGHKIAISSGEFAVVAEEVLSHHERWDGNGYPRELEGKEIPLLARIISIVDAYDVMTNERPYSPAMSKEEALQEIKECTGSQFDPELVQTFIEIMS